MLVAMSLRAVMLHDFIAMELGKVRVTVFKFYYYYYTRLMAFFPGQPGLAGTRKVSHSGFYWSRR